MSAEVRQVVTDLGRPHGPTRLEPARRRPDSKDGTTTPRSELGGTP